MAIYHPELAETDVRSQVAQVEETLRSRGAEVKQTDFWGKRRFAYEIRHLSEGYYAVVAFEAAPDVVEDLDRTLSLSDSVLRHKFIRPE